MKIAFSNLAWNKSEEDVVLKLLQNYNITGIEMSLTKIWDDPHLISERKIKKYRDFWNKNKINIVAITSVLFGHPELMIFNDENTRNKTLKYLGKIFYIGSILGAKAIVFGSPKNRNTNNLPKKRVSKISEDFFSKLSDIAKQNNMDLGIEGNPKHYGTDFLNTTTEVLEFVKSVNHPNIKLHLDSGTMRMNNEDYQKTIEQSLPYTSHFHISEPFLKPVPQKNGVDHKLVAKILRTLKYDKWVSVEMPLPDDLDRIKIIKKSLDFVTKVYG